MAECGAAVPANGCGTRHTSPHRQFENCGRLAATFISGIQPTVAGQQQRRLSAILAADVAGYTQLVERDTDATVTAWQSARTNTIDPAIAQYSGRIVKHTGDGFLAEFATVHGAVLCAIAMQEQLSAGPLDFRMGISLGDVIDDGEDIHGEGVNIAARLEALAQPGGLCISGGVYEQIRNQVEVAFEELGEHRLKHVSAPVKVYGVNPKQSPGGRLDGTPGKPTEPDKPSIAVLPFDNMSNDPEQDYFSDGISEDIITNLCTIRWLFVIARNSSFTYKGKAVDVRDVATDLGVRYVLEGSVRKAASKVRITAQLIDAQTSSHLWAERYDRDLTDIFAVQDEITENVTGAIQPAIVEAEGLRARNRSEHDVGAWDMLMQAVSFLWRMTKADSEKVIELLEAAINKYPGYSPAHSTLAFALLFAAQMGWLELTAARDNARALAKKSRDLDDQDPWAHLALGYMHAMDRNADEAVLELDRAVNLSPSFAAAYGWRGFVKAHAGLSESAIADAGIAMRLSPKDPQNAVFVGTIGLAHYLADRYEEALSAAEETVRLRPGFVPAYRLKCAILARSGRIAEAQAILSDVRKLQPDISASLLRRLLPYPSNDLLEKFVGGLLLAGLPE